MYVITAWEDSLCVWEGMYDEKPSHEQVIDDMLREGVHADAWDYMSSERIKE
jgi:hypothetical protein